MLLREHGEKQDVPFDRGEHELQRPARLEWRHNRYARDSHLWKFLVELHARPSMAGSGSAERFNAYLRVTAMYLLEAGTGAQQPTANDAQDVLQLTHLGEPANLRYTRAKGLRPGGSKRNVSGTLGAVACRGADREASSGTPVGTSRASRCGGVSSASLRGARRRGNPSSGANQGRWLRTTVEIMGRESTGTEQQESAWPI